MTSTGPKTPPLPARPAPAAGDQPLDNVPGDFPPLCQSRNRAVMANRKNQVKISGHTRIHACIAGSHMPSFPTSPAHLSRTHTTDDSTPQIRSAKNLHLLSSRQPLVVGNTVVSAPCPLVEVIRWSTRSKKVSLTPALPSAQWKGKGSPQPPAHQQSARPSLRLSLLLSMNVMCACKICG